MAELEKIPIQETPAIKPETVPAKLEQSGEVEIPKPETQEIEAAPVPAPAVSQPTVGTTSSKDETTKNVESVLEEGLGETYKALPPEVQKKFRDEGEKVTTEISGMIKSAKIKARKVLDLIRAWLKIIPHINRHFLDQEAKIKTDRIMHLGDVEKDKQDHI